MQANRVALVTGAARRVGRAMALSLAREGFDVVFTYRSSGPAAESLRRELEAAGRQALAMRADLTDPQPAAEEVARQFSQRFDRLDVLVNNASLYEPGRLDQVELEQVRRMMAIHFEAPLLLCRKLRPLLAAARGHVVNMVDLLAQRPWPEYVAYCASKAALANLTVSLARELAPDVTVNGIAPGVIEWPDDYPQQEREKYLKRVPLGRAGTPEDAANLLLFLVTGGDYITGQIIPLDGGRSII